MATFRHILACCCGLAPAAIAAAGPPAYARTYEPAAMNHNTGFIWNTSEWRTDTTQQANALLSFGLHETDAPRNTDMLASITLVVDDNTADDLELVLLTVHDTASDAILANSTVRRNDFEVAGAAQEFSLYFTTGGSAAQLDYRVYFICCSQITHVLTAVRSLNDTGPISDFWSDQAHWKFTSKAIFPSADGSYQMNVGFHFVTRPGVWYLFHRQYSFSAPPSYCKADFARLVVTASADKGLTWANETEIASPAEGTPYECALVDGAAFWDADLNRWLYLSQCLARDDVWRMCAFYRDSIDPRGPFTPFAVQPSVQAGQLWSKICAGPGKRCQPTTADEGTPEIVFKDAKGYYYVTFHGWDPAHTQSARGVAKTQDFVSWTTAGRDLPGDAMFSSLDCNKWDIAWAAGGCVGGGEGSILLSGDFMYQLIEAPDVTLGCLTTPGTQNWVLGLSRAPLGVFLPSGQWQGFSVLPTVVPAVKQGCYIQYHRLFADDDGVYLSFWADNWLQIHVLVPGAGPLPVIAGPPPPNGSTFVTER